MRVPYHVQPSASEAFVTVDCPTTCLPSYQKQAGAAAAAAAEWLEMDLCDDHQKCSPAAWLGLHEALVLYFC